MRRSRLFCKPPDAVEGLERPPPRVRLKLVNFKYSADQTAQLKRLATLKGYRNLSQFIRDSLDFVIAAEAAFLAECGPDELGAHRKSGEPF